VWHPDDLPEGYHTTSRGRSRTTSAGGCVEGRPRAAARSGVARSTGCHMNTGHEYGRTESRSARTDPERRGHPRKPRSCLTSVFELIGWSTSSLSGRLSRLLAPSVNCWKTSFYPVSAPTARYRCRPILSSGRKISAMTSVSLMGNSGTSPKSVPPSGRVPAT